MDRHSINICRAILESPAKIIQKKKERLIGEFEDIVEEPF